MNAIATKPIIQAPPLEPERKPRNYRWLLLLLFIAISAILYLAKEPTETQHWETVDFIEKGADGEPQVPQKDLEKLKRDLDKMNNGVLYSLRAGKAGYYACYNCGDQDSIYLQVGEIWKYGVTYQGEKEDIHWVLKMRDWFFIQNLEEIMEYAFN